MMTEIIEIGATLFDSAICVWFLTKFNKASFRRNFFFIPAIIVIFSFQMIADKYMQGFMLLSTAIQFVLALIYAILISKKRYIRTIISVCICKITLIALSTLLYFIYSFIFNDFAETLYGSGNVGRFIYIATHKVLLFAVLYLVLKFFDREGNGNVLDGVLTYIFSLITVFGLGAVIAVTFRIDDYEIRIFLAIISIVFLALNVFLYVMLSRLSEMQRRNYELKLLGEKSKFEKAKYEEALGLWNDAQKTRHDVKHHLAAISGMLHEEEYDECLKYVDTFTGEITRNGKFSPSGNNIIDYLLYSKLSDLKDTQIVISGFIGDLSDIKETDLAALVGNILDNAVEAVKGLDDKHIELLFSKQNSNRIMIFKNTIGDSVLKNNKELRTTKKSPGQHGYGHQIVEEIVRRYSGLIRYYEESDMFCVQIVLPKLK